MINIGILTKDNNLIDELEDLLKKFFINKNLGYTLSKIETEYKDIDILITDSDKEFFNVHKILITDVFNITKNINKNLRYILKPINYYSLEKELSEYINKYKNISNILNDMKNKSKEISYKSILYVKQIEKNKSILYDEKNEFLVDENIKTLEDKLSPTFFRCNKEYLININKISKIGNHFIIINDKKIEVDKKRFTNLKNILLKILNF